jgi:hypothetical protein
MSGRRRLLVGLLVASSVLIAMLGLLCTGALPLKVRLFPGEGPVLLRGHWELVSEGAVCRYWFQGSHMRELECRSSADRPVDCREEDCEDKPMCLYRLDGGRWQRFPQDNWGCRRGL